MNFYCTISIQSHLSEASCIILPLMAGVTEEEILFGDKCQTPITDSNMESARTAKGVLRCGKMPAVTCR